MSELGPDARALFKLAREVTRPSAADRARSLAALRAKLPDVATNLPSGGTGRAASWKLTTLFGASGAAFGLIVTAWLAFRAPSLVHDHGTKSAVVVTSVVPPPDENRGAQEPDAPPAAVAASAPPDVPPATRVIRKSEGLGEEVTLLARAAADLNSGRYADALRELDRHRRLFPNGQLAQERRAARVRALCALGRREEATEELTHMSQQGSPDIVRARKLCGLDSKP